MILLLLLMTQDWLTWPAYHDNRPDPIVVIHTPEREGQRRGGSRLRIGDSYDNYYEGVQEGVRDWSRDWSRGRYVYPGSRYSQYPYLPRPRPVFHPYRGGW